LCGCALPHAETPFPTVFCRLQGKSLKDVSSEHWEAYQKEIDKACQSVTARGLAELQAAKTCDEMYSGEARHAIPPVLAIVFAYLYGGHEAEAWKALDEMWPAFDRERIRSVILEDRAGGVLRYTRSSGSQ
jgi:hypothetical protein